MRTRTHKLNQDGEIGSFYTAILKEIRRPRTATKVHTDVVWDKQQLEYLKSLLKPHEELGYTYDGFRYIVYLEKGNERKKKTNTCKTL